jgi:hypothetical protein
MSAEFMEAYTAALHGKPVTFDRKPNAGEEGRQRMKDPNIIKLTPEWLKKRH